MKKDKKQAEYFFIGTDEVQDLGKESFAHFTARTRFRKIFSEHCSGDYEKDFLEKTVFSALKLEQFDESSEFGLFSMDGLSKFFTYVNAKILHPHGENSFFKKKKNKSLTKPLNRASTLKEFFNQAPFFESEILFYHVLLAQKKYFSNYYDFFATEKKDSLENSRDTFISNLDGLFASGVQDELSKHNFWQSIHYCLSANTSDLSQLNAKERFGYEIGDIRILHDDTSGLYEYVSAGKKFKRFDIICDNAGKELFSDLYLACYFLYNDVVDKVVFHLKPYPFFVSDATKEDFGFMMNTVTKYGESAGASRCKEYIRSGRIEIEDDAFWASPYCFKDMPNNELYKQLCDSDLIIVKGDLNYRRLVEDRDWTYTDSFSKRTKGVFGNAPILAPRVLKSDVLVGVSEAAYHTAKSSDKYGAPADQRFKGSGKWAVVHFRNKKCKPHKKEAQEKNRVQQKHGDADCENTHKTEEKQSDKSSADKQKQNNSFTGRKSGFYATVNVCYILATVLILTMLVVSTVPVIVQTVAVMHENSDLPKTQETEQLKKTQENLKNTNVDNSEASKQLETERSATASADTALSEQVEPKQSAKSAELKYGDAAGRIDFSLLLTGYAIFLTGTLIIPKVLLKKEVEEGLEKYAKESVHNLVDKQFQERIKSTQNELYRTDAQLSRMIAFQLHEEYPVWSVGWAYRSLKRYKNLNDTKSTFSKYYDFIRFLEVGVIDSSIKQFHNSVAEQFKTKYPYEQYADKVLPLDAARTILEAESKKANEEAMRPALRAVKDISDFEYAVRFDESDNLGEMEKDILKKVAKCAGFFAKELCAVILWDFLKEQSDSYKKEDAYALESIMQNLLEISNYGTETKARQEVKQKFQQMLKRTLQQIINNRKSASYDYYDMKNDPAHGYFFADEESSYPIIRE